MKGSLTGDWAEVKEKSQHEGMIRFHCLVLRAKLKLMMLCGEPSQSQVG